MAYTKTNWVDNVTSIDKDNLNKIEQGIYDNSLTVDAVNTTVKPTGETYKSQTLTEGQITEVLGVSDIKLKGDIVQDGTPTPSAPVDINVVSGSNVISTSNKNLLDISAMTTQTIAGVVVTNNGDGSLTLDGTSSSNGGFKDISIEIPVKQNVTYTLSQGTNTGGAFYSLSLRDVSNLPILSLDSGNRANSVTPSSDTIAKYFRLYFAPNKTFTNLTIYPMFEKGSTATTHIEHQGKELPLDLPVENLFDGTFNQGGLDLGSTGVSTSSGDRINTNFISVQPSTTYTISNHNSNIYQFGLGLYKSDETYDSVHKINNGIWINFPYTFTTQSDTYYIRIAFKNLSSTAISPTGDYKIMLNKGLLGNAYTPYGTTPIELCKIGNYQDYFYKSGSKWYLHKEIGKVIYDGSENWEDRPNYTNADRFVLGDATIPIQPINGYSKYFAVYNGAGDNMGLYENNGAQIIINFSTKGSTTLEQFKEWLSTHNTSIYYLLASATNTEITDTTLKDQLESIYNAPLYEQTNITQENNDLPIILDITAFKDNINGIKAFIRK